MTLVTWHVIDRLQGGNVVNAQITVTAQPQGGFPFFRIDLFTDQFGLASADLHPGVGFHFYDYEISHPDYVTFIDHIAVGEPGPINIERSLVRSPVAKYSMTFQVTGEPDGRNLNLAEIKSDWNGDFFTITTDAVGRATVTYQTDKVGDHRVFVKRPNYGRWEGTVSFPPATGFKGIHLSLTYDIIDDIPVIIEKDEKPPTKEELDTAWKDLENTERLATAVLVALSIIYGMRALQGFSAARFKPI